MACNSDFRSYFAEILGDFGKTAELTCDMVKPGLAVVLVGNRPDSARYVSKKKVAKRVELSFRKCIARRRNEETLVSSLS